jgi:hypothetical protein
MHTLFSWPMLTAVGVSALILGTGATVIVCAVQAAAAARSVAPSTATSPKAVQGVAAPSTSPQANALATGANAAVVAPATPQHFPPPAFAIKPPVYPANPGGSAYVTQVESAPEMFGTAVEFVSSPAEAARLAQQKGRLQFILHVSGHFEVKAFT